jgi:hypothetical protein
MNRIMFLALGIAFAMLVALVASMPTPIEDRLAVRAASRVKP